MPATATQECDEAKRKIGTPGGERCMIPGHRVKVLADAYILPMKTHVYRCNVVGPLLLPNHQPTEEHYDGLFAAADTIAGRTPALGQQAPLRFGQSLRSTALEEETVKRNAGEMVEHLAADHEQPVRRVGEAAVAVEEVGDLVATDLSTTRTAFHEQAAWMLRAIRAK